MSSGSGSWSGPYSRHPRMGKGKGKGRLGQKGWIVSDEAMESLTTPPPAVVSLTETFPEAPPLGSDLRPIFVQEVKEWLRTSFTLSELDEIFF